MEPSLDERALYDFGFALVGDQQVAEALALNSLCITSGDHASRRERLLCSLRRLWLQVNQGKLTEFLSNRPQDRFLQALTLPERAAVAARFVLHLSRADCLAVFEISEAEETNLLFGAVRKIEELKGK